MCLCNEGLSFGHENELVVNPCCFGAGRRGSDPLKYHVGSDACVVQLLRTMFLCTMLSIKNIYVDILKDNLKEPAASLASDCCFELQLN